MHGMFRQAISVCASGTRKQATVGSQQCHKLEQLLAERDREIVTLQLEAAEASSRISALESETKRLETSREEHERQQEVLEGRLVRCRAQSQAVAARKFDRSEILAQLPTKEELTGKELLKARSSGPTEICRLLKGHLKDDVKACGLLERLKEDVQDQRVKLVVMQQREECLLQIMTGGQGTRQ
ncbi:unnamed protein product [Ostreobium quekettii]|uniref:Uncharacterized protein n=1 Tax=Ostreobium quekettii TaxID=121088 RepID=A0A8S1IVV1_9CHLO|nr:unnamed protein product [Ostreobium quekettii]